MGKYQKKGRTLKKVDSEKLSLIIMGGGSDVYIFKSKILSLEIWNFTNHIGQNRSLNDLNNYLFFTYILRFGLVLG